MDNAYCKGTVWPDHGLKVLPLQLAHFYFIKNFAEETGKSYHVTLHGAQINFGDLPPYSTYVANALNLTISVSAPLQPIKRRRDV
jgi:hypothetical protein